ncbi:MAG: acyl carrier protein [Spirochaetales bacterium]|nr:acyl carrier protein [Spirochaetales bacterium]
MEAKKEEIKRKVKDFIITTFLFGDTSFQIEDDISFMENGIIDSTGILEVIEFIESNFGVKIEDTELLPENLDSLDNIAAFLIRKNSQHSD